MVRIHHLNCVEIKSPTGDRAIGHCLAIEEEQSVVLIDAGVGLLDSLNQKSRFSQDLIKQVGFQLNESLTAINQLKALKIDLTKVKDCVVSHMDCDHISGISDFNNIRIHLGQEEYNNYLSDNPRYIRNLLPKDCSIVTYNSDDDVKWFGFSARRLSLPILTEVYLIPLFGHTYGHCGVSIKLSDNKWLFYVADAYYLQIELEDHKHPVSNLAAQRADNNELRIATLKNIKEFISKYPDIKVFSYHDPQEL